MDRFDNGKRSSPSASSGSEVKIQARSVSRGVAIGKVVCLHGRKRQFYRIALSPSHIEREVRRFRAALRLAKRQLAKISGNGKPEGSAAGIFDVHSLILDDSTMLTGIEDVIREDGVNAEWAVKVVTDRYIAKYKTIPDENLRERYIDLEDVAERIFTALGGGSKANIRLDKNSIIVARELNPSTLLELNESHPKAIITEHGGWTSHTFILAREVNLPAVTGVRKILRRVSTGDRVIVDGYTGQVVLHPENATLKKYRDAAVKFQEIGSREVETVKGTSKTLDGREITIRANVDIPNAYRRAKKLGAKGIGLYRSEFLFNQFRGFPTENEQVEAYRNIAALTGNDGVRIRTFDLSVDQLSGQTDGKEKNPALGLRAIRLSMDYRKQFRTQIRSLLRASVENNLSIVLPMISDLSEVIQTKKLIEHEKENLRRRGIAFGDPSVGAMIEVPSSVWIVNEIVKEVDFLCLGTNDLVQYMLAVDRDNESVADWFRTLHPAVIRAVRTVIKAAEEASIPAVVCGEMAGSAYYAPVLIGLGATELSMNLNSIPRVRQIISGIAFEEAADIAGRIEACSTADEAERLLSESVENKWVHLFPAEKEPKRD